MLQSRFKRGVSNILFHYFEQKLQRSIYKCQQILKTNSLIKEKISINNSIFHPTAINNFNFKLFFNNLIFALSLLSAYY